MKTFEELQHRVSQGEINFTAEQMKITDKYGWEWSIAHELAYRGFTDFTDEQMRMSNGWNWTVAHEMAKQGYKDFTEEQLKMSDKDSKTVADIISKKN